MPHRGGVNAGERERPDTRDDVERAPYNDAANDGSTTPQNTERVRVEPDRKQPADRRRKPHAGWHINERRIAVVSTQAVDTSQTRAATPDTGAVRHDNVVMIEAVTPRTHRGGKERATTPEAHQRTNAARGYAGAVTRRTKHRAGTHRLENTRGVRSDPRNIGARRR